MKFPILPLYLVILCFTLGYIISEWFSFFSISSHYYLIGVLILTAAVLFVKPNYGKKLKSLLLYLIFIGIGMVYFQNYYRLPTNHYKNEQHSNPPNLKLEITQEIGSSSFSKSFYAKVSQVNFKKTSGRVLLNQILDSTSKELKLGTILLTKNLPKSIRGPRNPGAFDYKSYLKNIRIYDVVELNSPDNFIVLGQKESWRIKINSFKNSISDQLAKSDLSEEAVGMLNALVLGNRKAINRELREQYAQAGIIHILAISGLHIGILLVFLLWFFRPLLWFKKGRWYRFIVILSLLWSYALFTGMSASVVRAVSMFSILTFSESLRSYKNSLHFLLLSFFVLLLCHPPYLKQIGFQMSYLAVFGILWCTPLMMKWWTPQWWVLKKFWELTSVCLGAQLAVAPLSVFYFHQFPGLFLLTNWVILPLFSLLLIGSMLLTFGILFIPFPKNLLLIFDTVVVKMNEFIAWIAKQEAFLFENIVLTVPTLLFVYLLLYTVILALKKWTVLRIKWVLISLIFLQLNRIYKRYQQSKINTLWVFYHHNNSLLLHQQDKTLNYFGTVEKPQALNSFKDFVNQTEIEQMTPLTLENFFVYDSFKMLIIKDFKPYKLPDFTPTHILLRNNPKINLERLLKEYFPVQVISDGSNAPWMVRQWKNTCSKKEVQFYDARNSGAYKINLGILE